MTHKLLRILLNLLLTGGTYLSLNLPMLAFESPRSNIAMWKVQSPNNTVYILGSIHVGQQCTLSSPRISQAMSEAEHIVFEIDFTQVTQDDQIQLSLDLAQAGRLRPGDRTLKDSIRAETYERLRQKYDALKPANLDISLDTVNQLYRPSFIAMQMQGFQAQQQGLTGECGIDKLLIDQAQAAQKNILALETFESQSKLIQMIVNSTPNSDLETEFQQLLSNSNQVNTLLTSVLAGDLTSIEKQVTQSCQATPTLCYQLLDQRNLDWMPQIKTYLQDEEDYFIIVGAAHMIGPNSLIKLLQNANYPVESF